MIDIFKKRISEHQKVSLTLTNGKIIEGFVEDIGDDYLLIDGGFKSIGVNYNMIGVWEIERSFMSIQPQPVVPVESQLPTNQDIIKIDDYDRIAESVNELLSDFSGHDLSYSKLKLKDIEKSLPLDPLDSTNFSDTKRKWDNINSQYTNFIKNNTNLSRIPYFVDELKTLANEYPNIGFFYYNAGCYLSSINSIPEALDLFEKAFTAEKVPKYIYNAAASAFDLGNYEKAYNDLAVYFSAIRPSLDIDAWYVFCGLAKNLNDYYLFKEVILNHITGMQEITDENRKDVLLSIRSILYILDHKKDTENASVAIKLLNEELLDIKQVESFLKSSLENLPQIPSSEFDEMAKLLDDMKASSSKPVNDHISTRGLGTCLLCEKPKHIHGYIYRYIPPMKYGFIRDMNGNEYYFGQNQIIDKSVEEELSRYGNELNYGGEIHVVFEPSESTKHNASVDMIALNVHSYRSVESMITLAKTFAKEKDCPHAIAEIDNALRLDEDNSELNGLRDKWIAEYEKNSENDITEKSFNLNPSTPQEWHEKGNIHVELEEYEDAAACFERADSITPKLSSGWYSQGVSFFHCAKYDEALRSLDKSLKLNPFNYRTRSMRGSTLVKIGKFEDGIADFNKAISIKPDFTDAWLSKGLILTYLKRYDEALNACNTAIKYNPNNVLALSMKSTILLKLDRAEEALSLIDRALEIEPKDIESLFTKGYVLSKLNRYDAALDFFNKSLEIEPSNIRFLSKKSFALSELGLHIEALEVIESALKSNHSNPKTWYYKGVVLSNAGEYYDALAALNSSLELDPAATRVSRMKKHVRSKLGLDGDTDDQFTVDSDDEDFTNGNTLGDYLKISKVKK
ncbi:MAG: tetratricopeptide repeat protein [Methanosarcinaceae archaeon]|nr:tetratricopeptide repeat protein [Methanosarcinaceae archaeon]